MKQLKNKSFLVLDDDQVVLKMAENHFKAVGAGPTALFERMNEAWNHLQKNRVDGFVLDWELSNESTHGLFSRIKSHPNYSLTPLIVICRNMSKSDLTLIDEFPATAFLQKPFTAALVTNKMAALVLEQEQYENSQKMIDGFMELSEENPGKAMEFYEKLKKKMPQNKSFEILAARTFRERKHFDMALHITESILERDKKSLPALTELAKIQYDLGKHDLSLKYLQSAMNVSPKNFDRIMLAGKAHLHKMEVSQASDYFKEALNIDPESQTAKRGIRTCKNMEEYFVTHGHKGVTGNLASLLNIIGVSFVRKKDVTSAIDQYAAAFEFAQLPEDKARVAFNLGLGYLRAKDTGQAGEWFTRSIDIHPVCKDKATGRLEKMQEDQMNAIDAPIEDDEILGGFIEAKPEEKKNTEAPKKSEAETDFDDFLDSFDIEDD